MGYRWLLLGLGLGMAATAWAQPTPPTPPAPPGEAVAARDPFESLRPGASGGGEKCRPVRSVADLLVEEVVVLGIFQRGGKYQALVRGAGLKGSTTIAVGQKLCNGDLIEVGPYTDENTGERRLCAVFRVQTDDPLRPLIRQVKCVATSPKG